MPPLLEHTTSPFSPITHTYPLVLREPFSPQGLSHVTSLTALLSFRSFPPGRQPPGSDLFYKVPFSNPRININFKFFYFDPDRNEIQAQECFRQAIRDCGDRRKHLKEMEDGDWKWRNGDVLLGMPLNNKGMGPWNPAPHDESAIGPLYTLFPRGAFEAI